MANKESSSKVEEMANFEFVVNNLQGSTQVRKHAMRASWKERKQNMQNMQNTSRKSSSRARYLAPKAQAQTHRSSPVRDEAKHDGKFDEIREGISTLLSKK